MPSTIHNRDQDLLKSYVTNSDQKAFAELARKHSDLIYATAFRVCGNRNDAQEVLQNVLVTLHLKASEINAQRPLEPWLHTVASLHAKNLQRKNKVYHSKLNDHALNLQKEHNIAQNSAEEVNCLIKSLDNGLEKLRREDREIIILHYLIGYSFKQISRKMEGSAEALQKRSRRALIKLASILQKQGISASTTSVGVTLAMLKNNSYGLTASTVSSSIMEALKTSSISSAQATVYAKTSVIITLTTMKTTIGISFICGLALSMGFTHVIHTKYEQEPTEIVSVNPNVQAKTKRSEPITRGFQFSLVKNAISEFDSKESISQLDLKILSSLIFTVPKDYLEDVYSLLSQVTMKDRFQEVIKALFARWSEIDPAEAYEKALVNTFHQPEGLMGSLITWLNSDYQTASKILLKDKSEFHYNCLNDYIRFALNTEPRKAAEVLDFIAPDWVEADKKLFPNIAFKWGLDQPLEAAEWISSYHDQVEANIILKRVSVQVAASRGKYGLMMADFISDPMLLADARVEGIYNWSVTNGRSAINGLSKSSGNPGKDISDGFPTDWNMRELGSFAAGYMVNAANDFDLLVNHARNEAQRQVIYINSIRNIQYTNPEYGKEAVIRLSPEMAKSEEGQNALSKYITEWNNINSDAARAWVNELPPSPQKDTMIHTLNNLQIK